MEPSCCLMRACVKDNMSATHDYLRALFTRKNGRHSFGYFAVAYMDAGKGRHQAKQQVKKTIKESAPLIKR